MITDGIASRKWIDRPVPEKRFRNGGGGDDTHVAYLFNTPAQQREMLDVIGAETVETLFDQIPAGLRPVRPLDLPPAVGELELESEARRLASRNVGTSSAVCFQGGGVYEHFIPALVDELTGRGEFYTAYTPYQAEASQGSLQAFFEFQTLICQLTGMDVANASLYEGGTAVSEAAFMAMRVTGRHQRVVVLESVHPEYREVLATYLRNRKCELIEVPAPDGVADPDQVAAILDDRTACLVVQHPNFFGCLEEASALTELARRAGALAIVSFDPVSLGLLERPGDYGADIAVAEGQSLGIPPQYGGPFLGVLACRNKHVRRMPGRLIGRASDRNGRDCFVLNLQTREQHIRREKATSNICTNQGLLALRATVYLASLGPAGLREAAELCCRSAHYAADRLAGIAGFEPMFAAPFFKEFAVRSMIDVQLVLNAARQNGFSIGPALRRFAFPGQTDLSDGLLVAVTECRTRNEIDALAELLSTVPAQIATGGRV